MKELGFHDRAPPLGHPICVSVPGAVAGWCDLFEKFGSKKRSLLELFGPAIDLARNGFVISETTAYVWKGTCNELADDGFPIPDHFLDPDTKKFVRVSTIILALWSYAGY